MRIDDLVTFAADSALEAAETRARAEAWKARAVGEAERIRMQAPGAREFMSGESRLGTLRLDGADLPPTASVSDPQALAAHLAKHAPEHAAATVTVPADVMDLLLGALESLGITATVTLKPVDAEGYLADQCKILPDADQPGAWTVRDVAGDEPIDVPGITATRPVATWKLIPNNDLRRDRIHAAALSVDEQVEAMTQPAPTLKAVEPAPELPATALGRYRGARTVRELRADCKAAGLPTSGTGAELEARLASAQVSA